MIRIFCHALGANFLAVAACLSLDGEGPAALKWTLVTLCAGLGAVSVFAGLALSGFRNCLQQIGIVLLSAAGYALTLIGIVVCLLLDPATRSLMQPGRFARFDDYGTGLIAVVSIAGLGGLLLWSVRRSRPWPPAT